MSSERTLSHSLQTPIGCDETLAQLLGLPILSYSLEALYLKVALVQSLFKENDPKLEEIYGS